MNARYTLTERFVVVPVILLPTSKDPEYRADCLYPPVTLDRRILRQIAPKRGGLSCCWYHGGDWHTATRIAIGHVHRLWSEGVHDMDEILYEAVERARGDHLSTWEFEAVESLIIDLIVLGEAEEGAYVNGRHRTQAMLAAGVRRTLTLKETVTFH